MWSSDGAQFGDGDLKIGQCFEQKCLKWGVSAVQLVDEQNGRALLIRLHSLQQRAFNQVVIAKKLSLQRVAIRAACSFGSANCNHLRRKIPIINSCCRIQPFVTLQTD